MTLCDIPDCDIKACAQCRVEHKSKPMCAIHGYLTVVEMGGWVMEILDQEHFNMMKTSMVEDGYPEPKVKSEVMVGYLLAERELEKLQTTMDSLYLRLTDEERKALNARGFMQVPKDDES